MRKVSVGDVMTRDFFYVGPDTNLLVCSKEMVKHRVNSLVVAEGKKLRGILTSTDILKTLVSNPQYNIKKIRAIEVATRKVAVIKPSSDIDQALNKMKSLNFRRLPVLAKGELVGIITLKDILRIDPSLYSETGELFNIKEEEKKMKKANVSWPLEGFCDNCGAFSNLLKVENALLCNDCREELY